MRHVYSFLIIFVGYLALTQNFGWNNLFVGLAVAVGINLLLPKRTGKTDYGRLPGALIALMRYVALLIVDIIKCGIQVAGIVLSPEMKIKPGVVAIPSYSESELGTALSAHAITITPGEMVVAIDEDGVMYTHCLVDATQDAAVRQDAQRVRNEMLDKIFL